jgi:L-arabinose isomerase
MLEGYSKTLEDGKYNFEGTAYSDLNDLKSKISNAVQALRDGTWD